MEEKPRAVEELEFVAESEETGERVAFTMADLYGWDDETVFLDMSIYLNRPREVNWAIVCRNEFSRYLNPAYHIHIRTAEDDGLIEPLKIISAKQYGGYRFMAEFDNHVVRTGRLPYWVFHQEGRLCFDEAEFERAEMHPRGLRVREDVFLPAKRLWEMSEVYVHYGCDATDYDTRKFEKIRNCLHSSKPFGGFWASPARARFRSVFDWAAFCERDNYHPRGGLDKKFFFCLHPDAHVFAVGTAGDFQRLPKAGLPVGAFEEQGMEFVDFEECLRRGIDAIAYNYTEAHRDEAEGDGLDEKMLGWDCDSILILNPEIVLRESFLEESPKGHLTKA